MPKENLTPEQEWAAFKLQEFNYRKMFHLSKAEMAEEPLEDVAVNMKIVELVRQKEKKEHAIMEMKAKMNSKK